MVRRLQDKDRKAVVEIFRSNVPEYFAAGEEKWLKATMREGSCPLFVVVAGGKVVGFGGYDISDYYNDVHFVFGMVHKDCHGKGYGRELLEFRLKKIAAAKNAPRYVCLDTTPAVAGFFEHCGFERIAYWADGYRFGFDRVDLRYDLFANPVVSKSQVR